MLSLRYINGNRSGCIVYSMSGVDFVEVSLESGDLLGISCDMVEALAPRTMKVLKVLMLRVRVYLFGVGLFSLISYSIIAILQRHSGIQSRRYV